MSNKLHESLYAEHLEEASFLYEHRRQALHDLDYFLDDLYEIEERFEAHVHGLLLGEEPALEICRRQALAGDFGELHAAVSVLCRADRHEDVEALATEVDWGDEDVAQAFADALACELPSSWTPHVAGWLQAGSPELKAALARAIGERRLPLGAAVNAAAQEISEPDELVPYVGALARLREAGASMLFYRCMQQPRHMLGRAAALAALRLGTPQAIGYLRQGGQRYSWAPIPLAIAGNAQDQALLESMVRAEPSADGLVGLGLLGRSGSIPALLSSLANEPLAPAAALGLYLLTGADIVEEVEVPAGLEDDAEEAEQASAEAAAHDAGDAPANADEQAAGDAAGMAGDDTVDDDNDTVTVRRISESPEAWATWLDSHGARFAAGPRYRLGELYSPDVALKCLRSTRIPPDVRQIVSDELCVRYDVDLAFEAHGLVRDQLRQLAAAAGALRTAGQELQPGRWVLGGEYA